MSAYEKFVEQAAEALARSTAHVAPTTHPWEGMSKLAKERNEIHAAAVLAVVGPLIAEDTRDRMVAAAAVAVEREGGVEWKATVAPCAVCAAAVIPIETAREYFFNGDEADEVWVDKP